MKFLSDICTGKDNLTYDVVGVLGAFAYIVFWTVAVFHWGRFSATDAAAYGSGLAAVLLGMAGAVKIKQGAEPEPK
jgi:hypothetical protein